MSIQDWLSQYGMIKFSPAGEGDGGGAGDGEGDGGGAGDGKQSILDHAKKGDGKDGDDADDGGKDKAEDWKAPETVPEHLRGKDAAETIEKLQAAYAGARKEIAKRTPDKAAGSMPKDISGYTFESNGDDDRVAAELNSEASKPIVDGFRQAALDHGIPDKQFAAFMRQGLEAAAAAGAPIGLSVEESQKINGEAQFDALIEMTGSKAVAQQVVNTVEAYGQKLLDRGTISKSELAEFRVAVGTAEAATLFYRIITAEFGERPVPLGDGADGDVSRSEAQAAMAAANKIKDPVERADAVAKAQKKMERAFGTEPATSVRTSIL